MDGTLTNAVPPAGQKRAEYFGLIWGLLEILLSLSCTSWSAEMWFCPQQQIYRA